MQPECQQPITGTESSLLNNVDDSCPPGGADSGTHHPPGSGVSPLVQQLLHAVRVATGSSKDEWRGGIL
jgi:hypothetical protein